MSTKNLPLSQVEALPFYGRRFPFIPWSMAAKLRVSFVFASHFLNEIGPARFAVFWLLLPFRLAPTYRKHRDGFKLMGKTFGFMAEIEWLLLVIICRYLEPKNGPEGAYLFAKKAIQDASQFMMNDFYQADRLAQFEDPFEEFWRFHKAMFQNDPNYPNEMVEEKDLKVMIVHRCRYCEIAALTVPQLAPLGCDHDITGFKAIENKTNMEFRRPETLAKDGKPCRFMFYRQGTAPPGNYEVH
jgi:hypothetical protein